MLYLIFVHERRSRGGCLLKKVHKDFQKICIIIVVFGITAIGLIWGDLLWKVHTQQEITINNGIKDTTNFARAFEEHILRTIQSADQLTIFLKYQYEHQRLDMLPFRSGGELSSPLFVLLSIVDENGDLVVSNQEPFVPSNIKDREHFKIHQQVDDGNLYISKPVLGRSSGKWSIQITRRINKVDGSFGGIVVVSLDPYYFTKFYQQVNLGKNSTIALVGRDGLIRIRQPFDPIAMGFDLSQKDQKVFTRLMEKEVGYFIDVNVIDGMKRIYSHRAIAEYPFIVVVGIAEEEALAEFYVWQNTYYQNAAVLTGLILLALGLIIYMLWIRRKADIALRESRERFEALVKQSTEILVVYHPETLKIVEVNAACIRLSGYAETELLSMKATDIIVLDDTDLKKMIRVILVEGRMSDIVVCFRHKSGNLIYTESNNALIEFQNQKLILCTAHDFTEERKLQEKIQHEVELAGAVQRAMLPSEYNDERICIRTIYESLHIVSGDFYGYGWSAEGMVLHGYMLDVAGHGMATALQGSAVSTLLNRELQKGKGWTAQDFKRLNPQMIAYFPEGFYASIIAFTLDFRHRTLTCVSGGINKIVVATNNEVGIITIPGSYVGLVDEVEFDTITIPVQYGDAFYFMTDGIYEKLTQQITGKAYQFAETVDTLRRLAVDDKRKDDCSALCIKIKDTKLLPLAFNDQDESSWKSARFRINIILQELAGEHAAKINICLEEAVANAMRYGSKVSIVINKIGNRMILRIRDNGNGFDGNQLVAAITTEGVETLLEKYLFAEHGRGIPIMVAWMDKVIYSHLGNEVMLVYRCSKLKIHAV